jgi:hypothetical protein
MSTSLAGVRAVVFKWLHFSPCNHEIIDVVLAAYVAIRLRGERLWIIWVDVPGSGKTEVIRSLRGLPLTKFLSTLSPKTLISGFRPGGRDYSLLPKLDKKLLVVKDLTAILDMPAKEQRQIFGTLRDASDGFSDHSRGNMDDASYDASFGFLAGVTHVIDLPRRVVESEMGDRYLKIRSHGNDEDAQTKKALENDGFEGQMREEIARAVEGFLGGLSVPVALLPVPQDDLLAMAKLTARMRAAVRRDHYHRISCPPSPEKPTRLVKQFTSLVRALMVVRGHRQVERDDMATAWRVALDTAPPMRLRVFLALLPGEWMSASRLAAATRLPRPAVFEVAEDLWTVGLLGRRGDGEALDDDTIEYRIEGDQILFRKAVEVYLK